MTRAAVKYSGGGYVSDGKTIPPERIREADRRRLRENSGKELTVDLLGGRSIKKTMSRLRPRV
ncbi:hypothetical protein HY488_03315 [Candidatus Woesearchaeota archaeon]|nr:hypothetical protein [Candidatus Woesearchaeota archaeon]